MRRSYFVGAVAASVSSARSKTKLAILANVTFFFWLASVGAPSALLRGVAPSELAAARADAVVPGRAAPAFANLSAVAQRLKRAADVRLRDVFHPVMSSGEKRILLDCLRELQRRLLEANIAFFMYGGTLLGSYRHHGLIPWDDDADVMVNFSQTRAVERALGSAPGYVLHARDPVRYKFYPHDGAEIVDRQWRWPFVDICFFGDNGTHVYDVDPVYRRSFVYSRADVFPLVRRPLDDLLLPAPKESETVLLTNYDPSVCATSAWSHRREVAVSEERRRVVRCARLHNVYPFVFREGARGLSAIEMLRIGGAVIKEFVSE